MDIINHLLGTCGEFHPNLFTVSFAILFVSLLYKGFKTVKNN